MAGECHTWVLCLEGPFILMWVAPCAACWHLARFSVSSGCKGIPLNIALPWCLWGSIAFADEVCGAVGGSSLYRGELSRRVTAPRRWPCRCRAVPHTHW